MTKRRRMFEIEMPDDTSPETKTFPAGKAAKRGPMATAISENADSLREREEVAGKIRDENDALAHDYVRARAAGLVIEMIPLDAISTYKLIRDRTQKEDFDLNDLVNSIRDLGLSNPIRLEEAEGEKYELIQGFRRLQAYKTLRDETGDADRWGRIPAGVLPRGEGLAGLYRRMVDENLIRKDLSFAEMATLAVEYAKDPQIEMQDPRKAVATLFESASYQKRSYIRSFIPVVEALSDVLDYPHELPRALGLAVSNAIETEPAIIKAIRDDLAGWENRSVKDEMDVLRRYAGGEIEQGTNAVGQGGGLRTKPAPKATRAKTSFELAVPRGKAKCVAGAGRLEIKMDRDFSAMDRRKLEAAVQSLLDQLDI